MEFEFSQEILDQIIFAMEDQTVVAVVDCATGVVVPVVGDSEGYGFPRYAPIPDWKPVDGYQLMERFVTALRNPLRREDLRAALTAGKGVFRSFKDALRRYPELEKRWYRFKEREMRRVVYEWYNQMRELQGLERLSLEPEQGVEDAEELIETDFSFAEGARARLAELEEADRRGFEESYGGLAPERLADLLRRRREKYPGLDAPESFVVVAEDQGEQLAGFAWGVRRDLPFAPGASCKILQLWVTPGYRGIGLGSALLRRLLGAANAAGVSAAFVEVGAAGLRVGEIFTRQGFAPVSQLLRLDVGTGEPAATEAPG